MKGISKSYALLKGHIQCSRKWIPSFSENLLKFVAVLRHTGQKRSFRHNLRLAILLCFTAGFINAAGYFAFQVLTTNVTGHAALLGVNVASSQFRAAWTVALWLVLFLAGALTCGVLVSKVGKDKSSAYTLPLLVIFLIVSLVAVFGSKYDHSLYETGYFAGALLFAMGMQNAFVSMISGSEVRTTHLTGMFTDLGIDLSTLAISHEDRAATRKRIVLRVTIIFFFLLGGVAGGVMFLRQQFHAFFIPAAMLIFALFYDYFRIKLKWALRKGHDDEGVD